MSEITLNWKKSSNFGVEIVKEEPILHTLMVSKTREKLIDVARQLFVHKGIEKTTMNDIAAASDKGRRTIYTYFKNKREIYNAVLEQESERLVGHMRELVNSSMPGDEKLRTFLSMRLEHAHEIGTSYTSIKALFKLDLRRLDKVRRLVYDKEQKLLVDILDEGVANGTFDADRCNLLRSFLITSIQGLTLSDIDSEDSERMRFSYDQFIEFIVSDITLKS